MSTAATPAHSGPHESDAMSRMQEPARFILAYLVFPLWVAAGFASELCAFFLNRYGITETDPEI